MKDQLKHQPGERKEAHSSFLHAAWQLQDPVGRKSRGLMSLMRRHQWNLSEAHKIRLTEYLEQYPVLKALYYASYQLDVPYGEDWELIQDILKQGPAVEVISPSRLRRKIKNLASEMASRYE